MWKINITISEYRKLIKDGVLHFDYIDIYKIHTLTELNNLAAVRDELIGLIILSDDVKFTHEFTVREIVDTRSWLMSGLYKIYLDDTGDTISKQEMLTNHLDDYVFWDREDGVMRFWILDHNKYSRRIVK